MNTYILDEIGEKNNIPLDQVKLSIAHNNKTGNQKYTYLTYPQDYELKNMQELLDFMDAEVYETSYYGIKGAA